VSPLIYHSLNLLIVVIAVIYGWHKVSKLKHPSAYTTRVLPFGYYSLTATIVFGVQCLLQLATPILSVSNDVVVYIGLLLGVIHNILWFAAVLPVYSKKLSEITQTLPLVVALSTVIASVTYGTGRLRSEAFAWIDGLSGFIIFGAVSFAIIQWRLSKVPATVFAIHSYIQSAWRSLWLKPFAETPVLTLIGFPLWRITLLCVWIYVISTLAQRQEASSEAFKKVEQVKEQERQSEQPAQSPESPAQKLDLLDLLPLVMISSTIEDLKPERDAAERAISALRFIPLRSEKFGSASGPPREICRALAEQCRIFILIIGERYGSRIEPERISVVEFEFRAAYAQNPGKILLYVKDDVRYEPEVEEFLKRLQHFNEGFFRALFKTPEELYEILLPDMTRWNTSH
jgi:hypothetical protein